MDVRGKAFAFDLATGWFLVENPEDLVMAAARPSGDGFTPTLVLRESRLEDPAPTVLAALSRANLMAAAEECPGLQLVAVEALPDERALGGERRRSWSLSRVDLPDGQVTNVVAVRDLCVAEDCVADLTATIPLAEPDAVAAAIACLTSLRPLPVDDRGTPATVSEPGPAVLDEWASARDGSPREQLPVPTLVMDPLVDEVIVDQEGLDQLRGYATSGGFLRRFRKLSSPSLASAGLVENGQPTALGTRVVESMKIGAPWSCQLATPQAETSFLAYGCPPQTLVAYSTESPGQYRLGFHPTADLGRLLLRWTGTWAAWPLEFERELVGTQFDELAEGRAGLPGDEGDFAEFCRQPWAYASVEDLAHGDGFAWVATPARGGAFVEIQARNERIQLATLIQRQDAPVWQLVSLAALCLSTGRGLAGVLHE